MIGSFEERVPQKVFLTGYVDRYNTAIVSRLKGGSETLVVESLANLSYRLRRISYICLRVHDELDYTGQWNDENSKLDNERCLHGFGECRRRLSQYPSKRNR
jgi:hypothetical protein